MDEALNQRHVAQDVVERLGLGIADLLARAEQAERRQPVEDRVAQLVPGNLDNDPLELLRRDVARAVLVKVAERLPEPLAL